MMSTSEVVMIKHPPFKDPNYKRVKDSAKTFKWIKSCADCMEALLVAAQKTTFDGNRCDECCNNYVCSSDCPTDNNLPLNPSDVPYPRNPDGYRDCKIDCTVCCADMKCAYLRHAWNAAVECLDCAKYPDGVSWIADQLVGLLGIGNCDPSRFGVDLMCTTSTLAKLRRCEQRQRWDGCK